MKSCVRTPPYITWAIHSGNRVILVVCLFVTLKQRLGVGWAFVRFNPNFFALVFRDVAMWGGYPTVHLPTHCICRLFVPCLIIPRQPEDACAIIYPHLATTLFFQEYHFVPWRETEEKRRKYKQKGLELMAGSDRVAACQVCASIMSKRSDLKMEPFIVASKKLDLIF